MPHYNWVSIVPALTSLSKGRQTYASPPMLKALNVMTNIVKVLLILFILLGSGLSSAEIYQCVDSNGKTIFSDQKCSDENSKTQIINPIVNIAPFKDVINVKETTSKSIYTGSSVGRKSRFINVSIYEETDTYIIFEIEVYYSGPENGRGEFRVMPNIRWQARSFSTSDIGVSSGHARVQLGSEAKDGDVSDVITLQLWQYTPDNSPKVLDTKVIPYKKKWVKAL